MLFTVLGGHFLKCRLGLVPRMSGGGVWIHASSVGEVGVAATIRDLLRNIDPDIAIFMTATTKMGVRRLDAVCGRGDSFCALPLDFPLFMSAAFRRVNPSLLVVVETELWPNLLLTARRRDIPILLANGRISTSTLSWARRFPKTFAKITGCIDRFLMKSEDDAANLRRSGTDGENIEVLGNLKFAGIPGKVDPIFDSDAPTIVFGSIRRGEFEAIADACRIVKKRFPKAIFIVAPRHLKTTAVAKTVFEKNGFSNISRRSETASPDGADVYLVDTMGELLGFYASADVVFVGGTLADYGGHNPLEPAFFGKPVLFGPYTRANKEAYDALIEADAAIVVADSRSLADAIISLLDDPKRRIALGRAAKGVVERMHGVSMGYEKAFKEVFEKR